MKYIVGIIVLITFIALGAAANAATAHIDLTEDAFGECVTEEFLDTPGAFSKFSKMPRTCIADPCSDISMDEYHYDIMGRSVTPMEFDAFLRKQDNACPTHTPRAKYTDLEVLKFLDGPPCRGYCGVKPDHPHGGPPGLAVAPIPASIWFLLSGIGLIFSRKLL